MTQCQGTKPGGSSGLGVHVDRGDYGPRGRLDPGPVDPGGGWSRCGSAGFPRGSWAPRGFWGPGLRRGVDLGTGLRDGRGSW